MKPTVRIICHWGRGWTWSRSAYGCCISLLFLLGHAFQLLFWLCWAIEILKWLWCSKTSYGILNQFCLYNSRPLPPIPDLEVHEESVVKAADMMRVWINHVLMIAHDIAIGGNLKLFVKVWFYLTPSISGIMFVTQLAPCFLHIYILLIWIDLSGFSCLVAYILCW